MKWTLLDATQYVTCLLGISLASFQGILSIILLVLSILLALINITMKVINALKDHKIDKDEVEGIVKEIEDLQKTIEEYKEGK